MGGLGYGRSRLQESRLWGSRLRESRLWESRLCPSTIYSATSIDTMTFDSYYSLVINIIEVCGIENQTCIYQ